MEREKSQRSADGGCGCEEEIDGRLRRRRNEKSATQALQQRELTEARDPGRAWTAQAGDGTVRWCAVYISGALTERTVFIAEVCERNGAKRSLSCSSADGGAGGLTALLTRV